MWLAAMVLVIAATGCSARPGESLGDPFEPGSASPPSALASPSAPQASASPVDDSPSAAVRRLLEIPSVGVELSVDRVQGEDGTPETLLTGRGRIEPAAGRGEMRYDLTPMLTIPVASALPVGSTSPGTSASPRPSTTAAASSTPDPPTVLDLVWTPDAVFARGLDAREWQELTREEARTNGGLLGRLPDDIDGLLAVVADSQPAQVTAVDDPVTIDGADAERWLVRVPLDDLAAHGAPAELPSASVLRATYGIDGLDIEVWIIEGAIRRLRYALARDEAPAGGPDRTTVTYDWVPTTDATPIELPA